MPYSVPQQTANERGVEGLPQSFSRMHTTWYTPGQSGASNKSPKMAGSWETNVLPSTQKADALGAAAAHLWKSNPSNSMTLGSNISAADQDGDGTIDVGEFKELLKSSGGNTANVQQLFAQMDKDGDGELTAEEIAALLDAERNKFKASNS